MLDKPEGETPVLIGSEFNVCEKVKWPETADIKLP
jgi:hypothetical protein